jgi:hypothetical protein
MSAERISRSFRLLFIFSAKDCGFQAKPPTRRATMPAATSLLVLPRRKEVRGLVSNFTGLRAGGSLANFHLRSREPPSHRDDRLFG